MRSRAETSASTLLSSAPGTIDIWDVDLTDPGWERHDCVLHRDERARFARMLAREAADRLSRCRIALRLVLSRYVDVKPEDHSFFYGPYGKPHLGPDFPQFNVSHSGGCAIFAVTRGNVGVDVERLDRNLTDLEILLQLVYHQRERPRLSCLPERRRHDFFRLWTRKEAYCKATGYGLRKPMNEFSIEEEDGGIRVNDPADPAPAHYIVDFRVAKGLMASVCSQERSLRLRRRTALHWREEV